jgi:heme/copper-type cytochrome/quinol oxidase subunit 4
MTEIEVPIEKIQEDIHHAVEHGGSDNRMMMAGALLSAILAVFAAISALMAGHYANEAMLLQIKSSDEWNFYQAKGIKYSITDLKLTLAKKEQKPDEEQIKAYSEKLESYKQDQEQIKTQAEHKQEESAALLHKHERLATSVTFFQIAIALTAIAVLVRRGQFMYFSGLLGLCGLGYLAFGLMHF